MCCLFVAVLSSIGGVGNIFFGRQAKSDSWAGLPTCHISDVTGCFEIPNLGCALSPSGFVSAAHQMVSLATAPLGAHFKPPKFALSDMPLPVPDLMSCMMANVVSWGRAAWWAKFACGPEIN